MLLALTREVSPALPACELTHLERSPIDTERAATQHRAYEHCLEELGCRVQRVAPAPELPDSVFIEDTAIVLDEVAVLAHPGAPSRRPEVAAVAEVLADHRPLLQIHPPGTLDGGDVLRIDRDLYVGASPRSNEAGAEELGACLASFGYRVHRVPFQGCLHLKSAVTLAADDLLLANPAWVDVRHFPGMRSMAVVPEEPFAGNVLRVGHALVCAAAHSATRARLERAGLTVVALEVSELAKAEGGVTCCSILLTI